MNKIIAIDEVYSTLTKELAYQMRNNKNDREELFNAVKNMLIIGVTDKNISPSLFTATFSKFNDRTWKYIEKCYDRMAEEYYNGDEIQITTKNEKGKLEKKNIPSDIFFKMAKKEVKRIANQVAQLNNKQEETF